jgi:hypothetical protein
MKYKIIAVIAFLGQLLFMFRGVKHTGKYFSPLVLLVCSLLVAWAWWKHLLDQPTAHPVANNRKGLIGAVVALLMMGGTFVGMEQTFIKYTPPDRLSDVLPQLTTQMKRWQAGEFPYQPVDVGTHIAYPVYLPLHWLPTGLTSDPRNGGYYLMALSVILAAFLLIRRTKAHLLAILLALCLPAAVLWSFIRGGEFDLPVSFELVIAAYYLVLAVGLKERHWGLIVLGTILCLLSRYTLVFWMPLMLILLWQTAGAKRALWSVGMVVTAVVLLYVWPFLLQAPEIFSEGLIYHNNAAISEWQGFGEPPVSYTMERGIHFALHLKQFYVADVATQVKVARIIQAAVMLALFGWGWWLNQRYRHRIHAYDLALMMLYLVLIFFYAFGPLTYRYYMVVPLLLSAYMCAHLLLQPNRSE